MAFTIATEKHIDTEAIRQRAAAAQPGPWYWWGDTSTQNVSIMSQVRRMTVMDFCRWGMQRARPVFCTDGLLNTIGAKAEDWVGAPISVTYQVAPDATSPDDPRLYRHTFIDIQHPDAQFIANARQDVDDLLTEIDRLNAIIDAAGIEAQS